jgi:hypothetical protein
MDTTVQVAIVAAAASVVGAVVSFVLNKRAERVNALTQRKIEHYRELLAALSDVAIDADKDSRRRLAHAVNTIALIAPQEVISALMNLHKTAMSTKPRTSVGDERNYQPELNLLLLAIRRSLELPFEDEPSTFDFTLVGLGHTSET